MMCCCLRFASVLRVREARLLALSYPPHAGGTLFIQFLLAFV